MGKLPLEVAKAARPDLTPTQEDRARRVILALAENLPESAVEMARLAYNDTYPGNVAMRAAIVASEGVVGKSDA